MSRTLSGVCAAMSTPPEKARSEPAKTIVLISGRASICSSAARSSSIIGMSMTFSGGLFSTMRAAGGCSSTDDAGERLAVVWITVVVADPSTPFAALAPLSDDTVSLDRHFPVNFAGRFSR